MKLTFLGGADEIGASCTLLTNGGRRILVDCGIRMTGSDILPHLAAIGGLDAILVTHAHMDHSGALPVIHEAFPDVPVLATAPTAALLRVMLGDSLKLMDSRAEAEGEVPLYGPAAVHSLLAAIQKAPLLDPIPLDGSDVIAQFFPAGHILGAASIGISGPEGRALVTGDIAVSDQLTVPGMIVPRFEPDVVVIESTYGDRLHSSRKAEEQRLVSLIGETIAAGGKVLVPAFALGRAQEVLLILKRAFARKELEPVPVYADGMVRSICEVYREFPEHLHVPLRRQMAKAHPFFPENLPIRRVTGPGQRQEILDGPPCVIVASSGMLSGGASVHYARALAGERRNLIALTGYQDEESPGRALLDLAEGATRELRLGGQVVTVEARVAKVGLSAHADRAEILGLLDRLKPGRVVLVHGEGESRLSLARSLGRLDEDQIHLPRIGDELDCSPRRPRRRPPTAGIGRGAPLDAAAMARLAEHLRLAPRPVTPRDLAILWAGGPDVAAETVARVQELLTATPQLVPDRKRPFLYRPADPAAIAALAAPAGPMGMQEAFAIVDRLLPPGSGLYKKSFYPEAGAIQLAFHFPDVARTVQAEALTAIADRTGYQVRLKPEPHGGELTARALALVPAVAQAGKAPSIHLEAREVRVKVQAATTISAEVAATFQAETGFRFVLEADTAPLGQSDRLDSQGRMEINAAFAAIDQAFRDQPHRPRKKSKKTGEYGPFIELAFISPAVGERYHNQLEELEGLTRWEIGLSSTADQTGILAVLREIVPQDWNQLKTPSFQLATASVRLRLDRRPPPQEVEALAARLLDLAGFHLEIDIEI